MVRFYKNEKLRGGNKAQELMRFRVPGGGEKC